MRHASGRSLSEVKVGDRRTWAHAAALVGLLLCVLTRQWAASVVVAIVWGGLTLFFAPGDRPEFWGDEPPSGPLTDRRAEIAKGVAAALIVSGVLLQALLNNEE